MRFSPHALGRSDRLAAVETEYEAFARIAAVANEPARRHPAPVAVLQLRARDQAVALAALGDRETLERTVALLGELEANDPLVGRLRVRMGKRKRGRVDIAGLLP